jgi:hypothetical protein
LRIATIFTAKGGKKKIKKKLKLSQVNYNKKM